MEIEIGQVLSLRIRYNNSGTIANKKHPYLVVRINNDLNTIEIAQLDSLVGKLFKAAMKCNKTIFSDNPDEIVIDKDSYIQLDNTILVERYDDLCKYRRQEDKLSPEKLEDVLNAYNKYHHDYHIDENKQVYMAKDEIEDLNSM